MSHYCVEQYVHDDVKTDDFDDGYDVYADDYVESFERSYYGAAKLPSGAGKANVHQSSEQD